MKPVGAPGDPVAGAGVAAAASGPAARRLQSVAPVLRSSLLLCAALLGFGCQARPVARQPSDVALCARGADGVSCARWDGHGFDRFALWSAAFSDGAGWGYSQARWGTLRMPDLDHDGRSDFCGRNAGGLVCVLRRADGAGFGNPVTSPVFTDDDGYADIDHAGTLSFVDIDGDHALDACARGPRGVECARGDGHGGFQAARPIDGRFFSDARGYNLDGYGDTVRFGDVDGDGRDDLCGRAPDGVYCALSRDDGFTAPRRFSEHFTDGAGWDRVGPGRTLALVDVDGDHRVDLCGRNYDGVDCALSKGDHFAPAQRWSQEMHATFTASNTDLAFGTLRFADLDGDGRTDLCTAVNGAFKCALSLGNGFGPATNWGDLAFLDHVVTSRPLVWATLTAVDLDRDGRADLCAATTEGVACAYSDGARFTETGVSAEELHLGAGVGRSPELVLMGAGAHPTAVLDSVIARENSAPGTPGWWVPMPQQAIKHEVEAYTGQLSYRPGDSVDVHASTLHDGDPVRWTLYRTGYYQGVGARLVASGNFVGSRRPLGGRATWAAPARVDWPVTVAIPLDPTLVSGVYLLRLDNRSARKSYLTSFVVHDDSRVAELVVQRSDFTDVAYNNWDGIDNVSNFYHGTTAWVSWQRPVRSFYSLGRLFSYSAGYFTYEYPMVRWLERQGYDVKYVSNADVHADAATIAGAKAFLSVGHDEYWSSEMRDHVEQARDAGTHIGFFSSDQIDVHINFDPSQPNAFSPVLPGTTRRDEWAKKPVDATRPPHDNPGDTLTGTHYARWCIVPHPECGISGDGQPFARLTMADEFSFVSGVRHPALRTVRLTKQRSLHRLLAYEYEVPYAGVTPLPIQPVTLAEGRGVPLPEGWPVMMAYQVASGARVFNAGSMHWGHALDSWSGRSAFRYQGNDRDCGRKDDDCFDHANPSVQQLTANVLADFGARPATPSPGLRLSLPCDWLQPGELCLGNQ